MTRDESLQKLKDLEKILDDPEVMDRFSKIIDKYEKREKEIQKKVCSKEYKDWLYTALLDRESIDTEMVFNNIADNENLKLLGAFHSYLESIVNKSNRLIIHLADGEEYLFFRLHGAYFKIGTIYGQGTITYVELLDRK